MIPSVIYGGTDGTVAVSVNPLDLKHALSTVAKKNTLLKIKSESTDINNWVVLLADYQKDPVDGHLIHADFKRIDTTKEIHVHVPLTFIGKPKGAADGGILNPICHTLEVACIPDHIPPTIEVDVTELGLNQILRLNEIKLPTGVRSAIKDLTTVIVSVSTPREIQETVATPEAALATAEGAEQGAAAPAAGAGKDAQGAKDAKTGGKDAKTGSKDAKAPAKDAKPAKDAGKAKK